MPHETDVCLPPAAAPAASLLLSERRRKPMFLEHDATTAMPALNIDNNSAQRHARTIPRLASYSVELGAL
jgi:hypothetical protein